MVRFRFGRFAIALASVSDLDQAMFYFRSAAPTGRLSPPFGFRLSYQTDSHSLILVVGFRSIFNVLLRVPRMVLGFGVFDPGVFRFVRFPSCTVLCWWRGAFNPIAAFRVTFLRKLSFGNFMPSFFEESRLCPSPSVSIRLCVGDSFSVIRGLYLYRAFGSRYLKLSVQALGCRSFSERVTLLYRATP